MRRSGIWKHLIAQKQFRVNGLPQYWDVCIWDTNRALKGVLERNNSIVENEVLGVTIPSEGNGGCLGEIHFCMTSWNDKVVAHEIEHATLHTMRVFGISTDDSIPNEERVCYMHARLFHEVYSWLWAVTEGER